MDAICLDFDSTISTGEMIDDLAKMYGKHVEVNKLSEQALIGNKDFQVSLLDSFKVMQVTESEIDKFVENFVVELSPGVSDFISYYQKQQKPVFIISGGFHRVIDKVARKLNIPHENIYANALVPDPKTGFMTIDKSQLTAQSHGKHKVIECLKKKHGFKWICHIGDGVTDSEVKGAAAVFIQYVGVRASSKELGADFVVADFTQLF